MDIEKAILKAEKEIGVDIAGVVETKKCWIFEPDLEGASFFSVVPCLIKATGEFKWVFPPDEPDLFDNPKPVKLSKGVQ